MLVFASFFIKGTCGVHLACRRPSPLLRWGLRALPERPQHGIEGLDAIGHRRLAKRPAGRGDERHGLGQKHPPVLIDRGLIIWGSTLNRHGEVGLTRLFFWSAV